MLQICNAQESSTDAGLALAQESPAHLLAARRSAYKKATSEPPAPSPCGYRGDCCHPRTQCKARKHFCGDCGKPGHFATVCRQKTRSLQQATLGHLYLHQTGAIRDHLVSMTVKINNDFRQVILWLPDRGADVDALRQRRAGPPSLGPQSPPQSPDHQTLRAANCGELGSLGTLPATLKLNHRTCHTELHIYCQLSVSLLSKSTCTELGSSLRKVGHKRTLLLQQR